MVEESEQTQNQWMSIDQSSGVEIDKTVAVITESMVAEGIVAIQPQPRSGTKSNDQLGVTERALSAAGAAFLSAIIVNPLDVAKMFADLRCSPSCTRAGIQGTVSICPPDCFQYKGTLDVFYKIIRQVGIYLPCCDIFRNQLEEFTAENILSMTSYAALVAGALARSLACTSCYPIELAKTCMQAFEEFNRSKKPPCVWKTLIDVVSHVKSTDRSEEGFLV